VARKVKLGIIGCGGMGNHHANVLKGMEQVEIVAACDLIEAKARDTAERVAARWCTDFRELLDDVDAVWVCTEPFNRLGVVTACAAAGKHIFTEKPIALNLAEADEMIAAAREASVKYMVGYVLRFTEPYRLMRQALADGELGELVTCWTRRYMPWEPARWYGSQQLSGGVALDFGSHDVDWLRWVGGDVASVFGRTFVVRPGAAVDEHSQTLMSFRGGGMGTCDVSWSASLSESSVGVVGSTGSLVVGRDGAVRRKLAGGEEEVLDVQAATGFDPKGNIKTSDKGTASATRSETIQQHFFRCIAEDIEPITSAADARKTLATVLAIQESSRTGQAVVVS
jgi:UDP-N-acetylglucosamine 3-dehydrogenase